MVDRAFKLNIGRQGFGLVNPEIRIIEGWTIKVLLYVNNIFKQNTLNAIVSSYI